MRRKKMLITIALIVIMLLNCIAPMLEAQAATAKTTISFNSALYQGLKAYFQEQGIKATYNDGLNTIKMDSAKLEGIEELSLKEKGISDLTGLDVFTGVKRLILSGNNLDESSNLSVLNNFSNLNYLDISSNQISDISSIQSLVERLIALDSNAINLTGQIAKVIVDVSLDSKEEATEIEYELPQILQMAGMAENGSITNKGILKADWVNGKYYEPASEDSIAPYIVNGSIPNPVSSTNNKFKIVVGNESNGVYTQYQGLVKWVISIKDTTNPSYNTNPASKNILKDSVFTLYYVVHSEDTEGVIFKDSNFYKAVKEQLTKNQVVNSDLLSYKYSMGTNDEVAYDLCTYSVNSGTSILIADGSEETTVSSVYDGAYFVSTLTDIDESGTAALKPNATSSEVTKTTSIDNNVAYPQIRTYNPVLTIDLFNTGIGTHSGLISILGRGDVTSFGITSYTVNSKTPSYNESGIEGYLYAVTINGGITYYLPDGTSRSDNSFSGSTFYVDPVSGIDGSNTASLCTSTPTTRNVYITEGTSDTTDGRTNLNTNGDAVKTVELFTVSGGTGRFHTLGTDEYGNETYTVSVAGYHYDENLVQDGTVYRVVVTKPVEITAGTELYTISGKVTESGYYTVRNLITNKYYTTYIEVVNVSESDASGKVSTQQKLKVYRINSDCRTLYEVAYDEPQVLVISDLDIANKITSLVLNDQRIVDLSGLEKFVGLESNLNVSYNYIDTMASIYALQLNKENTNSSLQDLFNERKSAMEVTKSKIEAAYKTIETTKKSIEEELKKISQANSVLANSASTDAEKEAAAKAKETATKAIYGDGENSKGLKDTLDVALNDGTDSLNYNLSILYNRLATMYYVYNNEYRLTTILTPELNYQTEEEYEAYTIKVATLEGAKELAKAEISRIATLESAGALTSLEKSLITRAFGLSLSEEQSEPISYALNDMVQNLEDVNAKRTEWLAICQKFIEIGVYSGATNYCLLERMNNSTISNECYAEEYLSKLITNYEYEGIPTKFVEAVYNENVTSSVGTVSLYNLYKNYIDKVVNYSSSNLYVCEGTYYKVTKLNYSIGDTTVSIKETVNGKTGSEGDIPFFYNQLMTLANKFTAVNEVSRYVTLPVLKRIDVRNNQIENFGDTSVTMIDKDGNQKTTTENLATLKNLKELYAGHNIVSGNIDCVKWSDLTALKKLDLSYNFITDISPLQVLKNLRYLDVSDNLLEGAFNLSLKEMSKLEDIILAGNKYTDISRILTDYEMDANGDFTRYFAREDTLNIDLSRQELEIDLTEEPIAYDRNNLVYAVELPPIFAQLEYIDATRTAYGTTSSKGTITAKGGKAYVPVSKTGEFVGIVKVIAANGYPEDVTTSIGIDSSCTIKYIVQNISVSAVKINEDISRAERGTSVTFTATVEGQNVPDATVEWDVEGNTSANTTISEDGVLTIAADEAANEITVIATSNYDDSIEARKTITLFTKSVTSVTVSGEDTVRTGATATYTATVEGENLEDSEKTVTWAVSGNSSANTNISESGVLTVAEDETADNLVVTATSTFDATKAGTKVVTVSKKLVTSVTVTPSTATVKTGRTVTFTAVVEGTNLEDSEKTVAWAVSGNSSANTKLTSAGVLTVGSDETATTLTVTATSSFDLTKSANATVTVTASPVLPTLGYTLDNDDDIIGVSPDTASRTFKSKLVTDSSYTVTVTRDGAEISNGTSVATGDIVTISKDGEVVGTFEVVVKGDVNGDGTVDISDTRLVKSHRSKVTTLTGLFLKAADVDSDGDITVSDVRLILAHRAKIEGYIL